jgi:hypothetical protein
VRSEEEGEVSTERERTAYREAGRAAVLMHLGIELGVVSTGTVAGAGTGRARAGEVGEELLRYGSSGSARAAAEPEIMALLAGPLAEEHRSGGYDATAGDRDALKLAVLLCGDEEEAAAYLAWLRVRTRKLLVNQVWPAVLALAAVLLERESVPGEEALEIMAAALRAGRPKSAPAGTGRSPRRKRQQ